jgi:hypothetical protein
VDVIEGLVAEASVAVDANAVFRHRAAALRHRPNITNTCGKFGAKQPKLKRLPTAW